MIDVARTTTSIRRRFLALLAIRWLPNGMLTIFVLVLTERGFTLSQLGLIFAAQGVTVFLLELPTGGLADVLGRKPVLMAATALDAAALALLVVADTVELLVLFAFMQGIYRALESGPLDAWLVDALHDVDPGADIESAIGAGGVAVGLSIGSGALIASGLVAVGPVFGVDALVVPLIISAGVRLLEVVALGLLMTEDRARSGRAGVVASVRVVPSVIRQTTAVIGASRVLVALIAVELFWGFGLVAFETLVPIRLAEVTSDVERAATLFGPVTTVAWIVSASAAWLAPKFANVTGTATAAMALHAVQAATVVGMALFTGPTGVVIAYLLTVGAHGAINPLYRALLHRQASPENRTTVLSASSMASFPGFTIGAITLGLVADSFSISTAMIVGAVVLLGTIPLYLPARADESQVEPRAGTSGKRFLGTPGLAEEVGFEPTDP